MSGIPKKFIILALVLPVAALLGYLLTGPLDYTSIAVYSLILAVILVPLVIQHHHALVILSLNATVDIFFLPGKPQLWMLIAMASVAVTFLGHILNKESKLIVVPSVLWTLVGIVLVAAVTAKLTGGLGMKSLGDAAHGGKRYVFIGLALIAFVAVSVHRIPVEKAPLYVGLFFLSSLTSFASNLIYIAGPGLWWLYLFFPVDSALGQAYEDFAMSAGHVRFTRLVGFAPAAQAALCFLLARTGIRGLFDVTKPWRMLVFLGTVGVSMLAGFRSALILILLILMIQFWLEGLHRTRILPALILGGILGFLALIPMVSHLPRSVQRTLSVLPLEVDPAARADAIASTDWRLQMWGLVAADIPKYFWLGKGYSISGTDLYLAAESSRRGLAKDYELSILAGDYHSGPLSMIIPFGIWGVLAFLAFLIAASRLLIANYRHGDTALKLVNTLLLAYFMAKVIFFFGVFGQIHLDLVSLATIAGLSISLNGGMARPATAPATAPARNPRLVATSAPVRWRPARS